MSFPTQASSAMAYTQGFGSAPQVYNPIIAERAPNATDTKYPVGKIWIHDNQGVYILEGLVSAQGATTANWVQVAAGTGGTLTIDSNVSVDGTVTTDGLEVTTATNGRIGIGEVLVGGTVSVANTSVTANTVVLLSITALGTVTDPQPLLVTKTPGVGFDVTSANVTDTSTFDYVLIEAV